MCSCASDFTCSKCLGTPQDWRYFEDERDPEPEPPVRETDGRWSEWL